MEGGEAGRVAVSNQLKQAKFDSKSSFVIISDDNGDN